MNFADRLQQSIEKSKSRIIAGLDPKLESFPKWVLTQAAKESTQEDSIYRAITIFYQSCLDTIGSNIASVKPNIAFFEQYGLGGIRAFITVCEMIRERQLPLVVDAKRGDIGSTAEAYSNAFLGSAAAFSKPVCLVQADALTVNPFLGFDTLEIFVKDCEKNGRGLFVLVKTSNPGSAAIQSAQSGESSVSETIACWVAQRGAALVGSSGYSSLGAVVGATYPGEAKKLRSLMPHAFFLIPGMGAQGGSAQDAVAGCDARGGGALINLSRGLFSAFSSLELNEQQTRTELLQLVTHYNNEITAAL